MTEETADRPEPRQTWSYPGPDTKFVPDYGMHPDIPMIGFRGVTLEDGTRAVAEYETYADGRRFLRGIITFEPEEET